MIPSYTKVFIVDDDPSVRKSLLRLLRASGWHGEAFSSAHEFLSLPAFSGSSCLILDVCMPGMMGPELCGMMAQRHIDLPVIFLTGSTNPQESLDPWIKETDGFLTKPVEEDKLLRAVQMALERHAASQNGKLRPASPAFKPDDPMPSAVEPGNSDLRHLLARVS